MKFTGYMAGRRVFYDKAKGTWHLFDHDNITILVSGTPTEMSKLWGRYISIRP